MDWSKATSMLTLRAPNRAQTLAMIVLCAMIVATIRVRSARYGQRFSVLPKHFPNAATTPPPDEPKGTVEILPPLDLTAGDFSDISQIAKNHRIFDTPTKGASDISPDMNDTRMTSQRIAFEFSDIKGRLRAIEVKNG